MEINGWVIYDDSNIPVWSTFTVYAPVLGDERDWRRITKIRCACGEECNTEVTDGFVFPKTYTFLMDRNDGWITLYMNSLFATKFILVYDGVEIYNSGYIGDDTYQSDLDNYLTNVGLPTEPIINTSFETFSFYKNSTVNEIGLYVYSPIGEFEASVSCPENPVTTTSSSSSTTQTSSTSTSSTTSTTTTAAPNRLYYLETNNGRQDAAIYEDLLVTLNDSTTLFSGTYSVPSSSTSTLLLGSSNSLPNNVDITFTPNNNFNYVVYLSIDGGSATLVNSGSGTMGVPLNISDIDVTGTLSEARITIQWS